MFVVWRAWGGERRVQNFGGKVRSFAWVRVSKSRNCYYSKSDWYRMWGYGLKWLRLGTSGALLCNEHSGPYKVGDFCTISAIGNLLKKGLTLYVMVHQSLIKCLHLVLFLPDASWDLLVLLYRPCHTGISK